MESENRESILEKQTDLVLLQNQWKNLRQGRLSGLDQVRGTALNFKKVILSYPIILSYLFEMSKELLKKVTGLL